ncbi:MAG: diadenylate cyclase [Kiritimatiellae bacterium]|nr:diadenylate cyclase [Kiritimatiellia bacterium]
MTNVSAIAQIAILYFVFYAILKGAKGSRFGQALMGFGILAALLIAFVYLFHFDVLTRIVQFLLIYIAVSTVVIFQPEIRRILSAVGAFGFLEKPKYGPGDAATPDLVVETLIYLADKRIGALLAFERGISLRGYEETGVLLDAVFSRGLVTSIFTPPLPLHDGGAVLRNGRLSSAHCIFPVSNNPDLIANGMRHRAAVGLSEDTDALVVAVSEETGDISVARNGKLFRYTGDQRAESLRRWLARTLPRADGGGSRLGALRKWLRKSADASPKGDRK